MHKITNAALFFLAAGTFTSVSILAAYQVLITIPLIYFVCIAVREKDFKLPPSSWWLLLFMLVALASLILNLELVPKPSKNFGRVKYFIFGMGSIYLLVPWLKVVTDKTKSWLMYTLFLAIAVASCYSVYTYFKSGQVRGDGLTETMRYGYGTGMMLLMLLSGILHRDKIKSWFNWKVAIAAFIFGFVGMYLTFTRGALLGFLCGLPFVLYFYRPKLGLTLGGIAVSAVIGLIAVYLFGSGKYGNRFLTNKNNSSDVIRRSQWKAAVISIQEKPILGWGLSNFHSQLKRIKNQYDLEAKDYNDAHSHNLFLEIASGTGLIGLFFFLGWLISWAIECFRAGGLVRACVVPFGVAFVISSQFEVTFDANNASMIFFIYALSVAQSRIKAIDYMHV